MDDLIFGKMKCIFSPVSLNVISCKQCINTVLQKKCTPVVPPRSDPVEKLFSVFIYTHFFLICPLSPLCFLVRRGAESFKVPADVFDFF